MIRQCVKSVSHYSEEEIEQLIVDMMAEGWELVKIENHLAYFKREEKDLVGYKQAYDD